MVKHSHDSARALRDLGRVLRALREAARITQADLAATMGVGHVLAATGDLAAVAELGQHANLQTTRRYTQRAASARASAAIALVSGRK